MKDHIMSIQSVSVSVKPVDYRCRFWAKVVRGGVVLPVPNKVLGANDVPGAYLKQGDEELFAGDFLLIGEEVHHRKARGWDYKMKFIDPRTGQLRTVAALSERKAVAKANGLPVELLAGSGEIAGLVRLAHAVRLGISIDLPADAE
ncbi:MAG TPA: hypothetical protein DDZ62_01645 [Delftia acidovorans]|nr:hypothetical protein [Delftia acidovorans]